MAVLLIILLAVAIYVVMALWDGFVLMTIWNWFMPNIFPQLPELGFAAAIGLGLVVSVFTSSAKDLISDDDDSFGSTLVSALVSPFLLGGLFLVMGAIVHTFL